MFSKEIDMQKLFITLLNNHKKNNEIIYEEFNGRFGNADVVKVKMNSYDFLVSDQINILKDYQCAKITAYLHKKQGHSVQYLMNKTNYTYDNITSILNRLKKVKIISLDENNKIVIDKNFKYPNIEFVSYELKLKKWKNAILQATKNKSFSSKSYIVVPLNLAKTIYKKNNDIFKMYNVGLIGIDENNYKYFYKPKYEKNKTRKNPTYISSLAKIIYTQKEHV